MREVKAIFRPQRLDHVLRALREIPGLPGITVSKVHAYAGHTENAPPSGHVETDFMKLETVVPDALVGPVVAAIGQAGHTGRAGDGVVFVVPVEDFVRIRDLGVAPPDGTSV